MKAGPDKVDAAALAQADAQLKKVMSDQSLASFHPAARRLSAFVRLRLQPERRLRELAEALLKKGPERNLYQDLWDYTELLDRFVKDDEEGQRKFESLPAAGREDDLTDWVLTFQVTDRAALDYSLQKWAKTGALQWLVASLSKIEAGHARVAELLGAANKVEPRAAGFATVAFHSIRLLAETGKRDEARKRLDALLAHSGARLPASSRNLFLSLGMHMARSLDEFLRYATQVPAGISLDTDGRELPEDASELESLKGLGPNAPFFSEGGARILNERMPLSVLKEAAANSALPQRLRRSLAVGVWTRAALLDNEEAARAVAPVVESLAPELKEYLAAYLSAETAEARRFAAVYLVLKHPGTRPYVEAGVSRHTPINEIDNYRDNWWCAMSASGSHADSSAAPEQQKALTATDQARRVGGPDFLTAAQNAAAKAETDKLARLGTAPNYLAAQAISYAGKKPDDPRAAEALHLAVRATRYGCTNDETTKFSKQAFQLLHRQYPKSEWAKKTKYWY